MSDLRGKVAVVTGASSGIGAAIALELAKYGVIVILVARREERLKMLKESIVKNGGVAYYVVANLMQENAVCGVLEKIQNITQDIHILVNVAGRSGMTPIDTVGLRTWYSTLQLNLNVPFEFVKYLLPAMKRRNEGWIINISSEVGCRPIQNAGVYGISKAALNRFTEIIDLECRDYNVHAYAICPGWVHTEMSESPSVLGIEDNDILEPDDIAGLVLQLCCQRSVVRVNPIIEITPMKSITAVVESSKIFFERRKYD